MSAGSTISNLLLPGLSLGTNAMGMMKAKRDEKEAQSMIIPEVDWRQQQVYDSLQQKKRALETGSAYAPQQAAINQQGLSAINAATSVAGGGGGATIDAISKIARGTGRTTNELYGAMTQEGLQLNNLIANTAKQMSDRSYQVAGWEKSQRLADAMKRKQQYQQNLTTAMTDVFGGGLIDGLMGGGKGSGSGGGGGIVSGVIKGAGTGSVVPGLGTAAGAIIGGVGGLVGGGEKSNNPEVSEDANFGLGSPFNFTF